MPPAPLNLSPSDSSFCFCILFCFILFSCFDCSNDWLAERRSHMRHFLHLLLLPQHYLAKAIIKKEEIIVMKVFFKSFEQEKWPREEDEENKTESSVATFYLFSSIESSCNYVLFVFAFLADDITVIKRGKELLFKWSNADRTIIWAVKQEKLDWI